LIDERPEEQICNVVYVESTSTFDREPQEHVKIANIVLEKAKRLVECGHDDPLRFDYVVEHTIQYNLLQVKY
jgi:transcription termination factor Rho